MDIKPFGVAQVANRAFVPLAIEAGIEVTLLSLVPLAEDLQTLVNKTKSALMGSNQPLADAINAETLKAILNYMVVKNPGLVLAANLPTLLDQAGPVSVTAARDGGVNTQINITFTGQPNGFTYEIYLDGVFKKAGSLAPGGGFTNEAISGVPAGVHTIRVLYVNGSGAQTRFGPIANISS